jgi:hypothetical protein
MSYPVADTMYDSTHTWQNTQDRVAYQRAFAQGTMQDRKIAQALITANPLTPNSEIMINMNQPPAPVRFGTITVPLTIDKVLQGDLDYESSHVNDSTTSDFSGSNGAYESTSQPCLTVW